jgi:hypothetical protein
MSLKDSIMTNSTASAAKDDATIAVPAAPEAQTVKKDEPAKAAPAASDATKK